MVMLSAVAGDMVMVESVAVAVKEHAAVAGCVTDTLGFPVIMPEAFMVKPAQLPAFNPVLVKVMVPVPPEVPRVRL